MVNSHQVLLSPLRKLVSTVMQSLAHLKVLLGSVQQANNEKNWEICETCLTPVFQSCIFDHSFCPIFHVRLFQLTLRDNVRQSMFTTSNEFVCRAQNVQSAKYRTVNISGPLWTHVPTKVMKINLQAWYVYKYYLTNYNCGETYCLIQASSVIHSRLFCIEQSTSTSTTCNEVS